MGRTHIPGRGKAGTKQRSRQVCAVRGCEYFGLTGVQAKDHCKSKSKVQGQHQWKSWAGEFVFTRAFLVGHGEPAKHVKQETQNWICILGTIYWFWRGKWARGRWWDGRKYGDWWSVGSYFCELEAEGHFPLAVNDDMLLVLLSDLIWVRDTGKLVHLVFQS